jgi:hypothetical protein
MNSLEAEFLNLIDWRLWMESSEYDFYMKGLLQHFEAQEQKTELEVQGGS